jgi:hypothetical protein
VRIPQPPLLLLLPPPAAAAAAAACRKLVKLPLGLTAANPPADAPAAPAAPLLGVLKPCPAGAMLLLLLLCWCCRCAAGSTAQSSAHMEMYSLLR